MLLKENLDLAPFLVQNGESAGKALAIVIVARKFDGNSGLGEFVGGEQVGSSSWCDEAAPDEAKVAFSCLGVLQNQWVITDTMGPDAAANAAHANRLGELAHVDQKMLVLKHGLRAPAVHEDAMAELVLQNAEGSIEESAVASDRATQCGFGCGCREHLQPDKDEKMP